MSPGADRPGRDGPTGADPADRSGRGARSRDRGSLSERLAAELPDRFGDAVRQLRRESGAPRRKRVVLADRRGARPVSRTVVDLEEQSGFGESMLRLLVRAQLRTSLLLGGLALLALGGLPLLFWLFPGFGAASVFGVRVTWLLLGVLPFLFLLGVGFLSTRLAERHERDFVHLVER